MQLPLFKSVSRHSSRILFAYRCRACNEIAVCELDVQAVSTSVSYFGFKEEKAESRGLSKLSKAISKEIAKVNDECLYPKGDYKCPHCGAAIPKNSAFDRYAVEKGDATYNPLAVLPDQLDLQSRDPRVQAIICAYARRFPDILPLRKRACELDPGFAAELAEKAAVQREKQAQAPAAEVPDSRVSSEESEYRKALSFWEAAKKTSSVQKTELALKRFEALNNYKDSASLAEACRKKIEKSHRRSKAVKILLLAAAAFLLAAAGYFVYDHYIVPASETKKADRYVESGEYEKALSIYTQQNEDEKAQATIKKMANAAMEVGSFEEAHRLYLSIGDKEGAHSAAVRAGDAAMETGDPEKARGYYESADEPEKVREACVKLGDLASESGDFKSAQNFYKSAGPIGKEKWAETVRIRFQSMIDNNDLEGAYGVYREGSGAVAEEAMLDAVLTMRVSVGDAAAYPIAGKFGATIRDIDAQLLYCRKLAEAGYDLEQVYPDGVNVSLDLRQYTFVNAASAYDTTDYGKLLVFWLEENKPETEFRARDMADTKRSYPIGLEDYSAHDKIKDQCYTVRLLPGMLMQLPEEKRAESWEACDTLLIAETAYFCHSVSWQYSSDYQLNQMLSSAASIDDVIFIASRAGINLSISYEAAAAVSLCSKADPAMQIPVDFRIYAAEADSSANQRDLPAADKDFWMGTLRDVIGG